MKRIYKYELPPGGLTSIRIPRYSEVLHVNTQTDNDVMLWAIVDTEEPLTERFFYVAGTGHDLPSNIFTQYRYYGTVHVYDKRIVLHVFEEMK